MRIASWNINSIRSRTSRVVDFLEREDVDVLCLQETKCKDEQFPHAVFAELGYDCATWGTGQWNGVAILSRVGIENVQQGFHGQPEFGEKGLEPRVVGARCGEIEVYSCYIPNGRSVGSDHYAYKLDFIEELSIFAEERASLQAGENKVCFMGDFNVLPYDTDCWDPNAVSADGVYLTPRERSALNLMESRAGLSEVTRIFIPAEHMYTFWDYRMLRFPKDEGMRIDFAYCSQTLLENTTSATIIREERYAQPQSRVGQVRAPMKLTEKPSDHVPVFITVDN